MTIETERDLPPAAEPVRTDGPAAAALLAAGVGALLLGLFTTFAVVSEDLKEWLALTDYVGPLAGKTTYAVAGWLVAWAILHWLVRPPRLSPAVLITGAVLLGLGLLGTFPLFFEAFE